MIGSRWPDACIVPNKPSLEDRPVSRRHEYEKPDCLLLSPTFESRKSHVSGWGDPDKSLCSMRLTDHFL